MKPNDENTKLDDALHKSGFPLQLGIEHLVEHVLYAGWSILYREHAWKSELDGSSGYIDLVLQHVNRKDILVVECKRVLDTSLIFINEKVAAGLSRQAKVWFTNRTSLKVTYSDWWDTALEPASAQSVYCISAGNSRELLETSAAKLASATEALALEELGPLCATPLAQRVYGSVVVTTATLKLCDLDPKTVSLSTGIASATAYTSVPYVRFRKQLSYRHHTESSGDVRELEQLAASKERTVFVVNAESFGHFLDSYHVDSTVPVGLRPR